MPALDTYTSLLVVQAGGSDLPSDISGLLIRGRVTDGVDLPDTVELDFADERGEIAEHFAIGTEVKVRVAQNGPGGERALFEGEVTALEREDVGGSLHTRVRGLDGAARLMHGTRVAAHVDSTVADVVRKVARSAGLSTGAVEASGGVIPHIAQDNVSDWVFLSRLARMTGSTFTVTGKRLDFGPPTPARDAPAATDARDDPVVIEHGANAQYVRAVITAAEQVSKVSVRGWDFVTKQPVVSTAEAMTRSAQLATITPADIAGKVGSREYTETTGGGSASSQDTLAASLADRLAGGFAEVEAVVLGNPDIRCGVAVMLTGFGAPFDGRYTVSETVHDFSAELGYATTATVSNVSDRSLFGVADAGAAARETSMASVTSAIVTDNLDPDKGGRVKLKFPYASDDYESGWARTAHIGGGAGRGMAWLPEIGDEVLVAFDHGFFDRPVVLGGLFNGEDKPGGGWALHVDSSGVIRRRLTSRTGMHIEFVEDGSAESVQLTTNDGAQRVTVRQDGQKGIEVISEGPIAVTAKQDVSIKTASGNVTIAGAKVSIQATDALEMKGAQLSMAGTAKAELSGAQVSVKADAAADVSAGGPLTVKGAIVKIN